MNRKTSENFIQQPQKFAGCNQVSIKVFCQKSAKNALLHGKTAFKVFNGLALGWKTKTGRNEAATSPDPYQTNVGGSHG